MSEKIFSPLKPGNDNTKLIERFQSDVIIENYKKSNLEVKRFFNSKNISLYECVDTGYRFYYPYSAIGDAKFYEDLSKNRINYYSERWEHRSALHFINKNDNVLEIGSGFGLFLKMLKSKNIKFKGLELNPHAVLTCMADGLDVEQKFVQELSKDSNEQFDTVCFFQVLEHITEVHDFLKSSIKTLKTGGKLIVGVPNNNPFLFKYDKYHTLNLPPHHAGLWNRKSLSSLENIFPLKLETMLFEPLNESYNYYLKILLNQSNNRGEKNFFRVLNKVSPRLLKKFICKYHNGRNVLAVFSKV